jgi:hypothetical protein
MNLPQLLNTAPRLAARGLHQLQLSVVVAVVAVRDCIVPAAGIVNIRGVVAWAGSGVAVWIRGTDLDDVHIDIPCTLSGQSGTFLRNRA